MTPIILGIDPGLSGAMVIIQGGNLVADAPLPHIDKTLDANAVVEFALSHGVTHIVIEETLKRAQGGHWRRMTNWGMLYGAAQLVDAELVTVAAKTWQAWGGAVANVNWKKFHSSHSATILGYDAPWSSLKKDGTPTARAYRNHNFAEAFIMAKWYESILEESK